MGTKFFLIVCPLCVVSFKQETRFIAHLKDIHTIQIASNIQQLYDKHVNGGMSSSCHCGCNEPLNWLSWKKGYGTNQYLRGHNARGVTIFSDSATIAKMKIKRAQGLKDGRFSVWNAGKTKETDASVARAAVNISKTLKSSYESGDLVDWRIKNPEKALHAAKKCSETKLRRSAAGEITPWNKGKNKHNDVTMAKIAVAIAKAMQANPNSSPKRLTSKQFLETIHELGPNFELISNPDLYQNKYQTHVFSCKTCGMQQEKSLVMLANTPICFSCYPKESKCQIQMFNFIKSLCSDTKISDRDVISPKELDIFIPSKNMAIEFNGLYWHSETCKIDEKKYHSIKTNLCLEKNIKLIHIFEDEWRDKRPIVESMIISRLGLCNNRFMARKMIVRQLDTKTRRDFFNENHIDGDAIAKIAWGLFDGDNLMSALSLRSPFHKSPKTIELARFASKLNVSVSGGLSRLLSVAKMWVKSANYASIMTYVDTRFGDGHGYELSGFKFVKKTDNRFWWTDYTNRYDRFKYRANKALGLSEQDVASAANVVRIWGCENKVYELAI
jgi:hypothetical protein